MKKFVSYILVCVMLLQAGGLIAYAEQTMTIEQPWDIVIDRKDASGTLSYIPEGVISTEWGSTKGLKVIFDLSGITNVEMIKSAKVTAFVRGRQQEDPNALSYLTPTCVERDIEMENFEPASEADKFYSDVYHAVGNNQNFEIPNMDITRDLVEKIEAGETQAAYILRNEAITAGYDMDPKNQSHLFKLEIKFMEETDYPQMLPEEIPMYLKTFAGTTEAYQEFSALSEAGSQAVISYIDENKAGITDTPKLEEALAAGVRAYYQGSQLAAEDIGMMISHFNAEGHFYNTLSEAGKARAAENLLAADRSGMETDADFIRILDGAIGAYYENGEIDPADQQVEFRLDNGQTLFGENDASLAGLQSGIAVVLADGGAPRLENVKIYKNDTEEVALTVTGDKVYFADPVEPETTYTLSWTDLQDGVYDSRLTFVSTGVYTALDVRLEKDYLRETETIEFPGAYASFASGKQNFINAAALGYAVDNENIVTYADGVFTGQNRGICTVTFTKSNEGGQPAVSEKRMLMVYNALYTQGFDDGEQPAEPLDGNCLLLGAEPQSFTSEFQGDCFAGWFYQGEATPAEFTVTAGEQTFTVQTGGLSAGWHQAVICQSAGKAVLYVDGVEKVAVDMEEKFNTIRLACNTGEIYVDNVSILDVAGTICEAQWVTVRNAGGTITGSYAYVDPDADDQEAEAGTTMKWYSASSKSGPFSVISGQTGTTLGSAASYSGKYVMFEVTPANRHETGKTVQSEPLLIPKQENGSSGSGGGGGGSSSGNRGSGMVILQNYAPQNADNDRPEVIPPEPGQTTDFSDVPDGHWAYASIQALTQAGILTGYGDGTFHPAGTVTRAEFVSALTKALGLEAATYDGAFTDVQADDWYASAVAAAVKQGYINGFEDGSFGADAYITREQMAVIMAKALGLTEAGQISFADADDISPWARDSVAKVFAAGIMTGREDDRFAPGENAARAEMAVMLKKAVDMIKGAQ